METEMDNVLYLDKLSIPNELWKQYKPLVKDLIEREGLMLGRDFNNMLVLDLTTGKLRMESIASGYDYSPEDNEIVIYNLTGDLDYDSSVAKYAIFDYLEALIDFEGDIESDEFKELYHQLQAQRDKDEVFDKMLREMEAYWATEQLGTSEVIESRAEEALKEFVKEKRESEKWKRESEKWKKNVAVEK